MKLVLHPGEYVIARTNGTPRPTEGEGLFMVTASPEGTTIVCRRNLEPLLAEVQTGWRWVEIQGPFGFDEVGILRQVLAPLSVPIFAISTFANDHLLVKEADVKIAVSEWKSAGFDVSGTA